MKVLPLSFFPLASFLSTALISSFEMVQDCCKRGPCGARTPDDSGVMTTCRIGPVGLLHSFVAEIPIETYLPSSDLPSSVVDDFVTLIVGQARL